MPDLTVITPSRGRPSRLAEMLDAIRQTASERVDVFVCLDDDDPELAGYYGLAERPDIDDGLAGIFWSVGPRKSLSGWTNHAAQMVVEHNRSSYLASLGDDHRPRTQAWDRELIGAIEELGRPGVAYGDDGYQGAKLPTAWVMSTRVVKALGWMMLPACEHMYVDNAMRDVARAAGCLIYRPDVVIEHMHPSAGKAEVDESYRESNSAARFRADRTAYLKWCRSGLQADARKIVTLRARGINV